MVYTWIKEQAYLGAVSIREQSSIYKHLVGYGELWWTFSTYTGNIHTRTRRERFALSPCASLKRMALHFPIGLRLWS